MVKKAIDDMVAQLLKDLCLFRVDASCGAASSNAVSEFYHGVSVWETNLNVTAANPYLPDGDGAPCADW